MNSRKETRDENLERTRRENNSGNFCRGVNVGQNDEWNIVVGNITYGPQARRLQEEPTLERSRAEIIA